MEFSLRFVVRDVFDGVNDKGDLVGGAVRSDVGLALAGLTEEVGMVLKA